MGRIYIIYKPKILSYLAILFFVIISCNYNFAYSKYVLDSSGTNSAYHTNQQSNAQILVSLGSVNNNLSQQVLSQAPSLAKIPLNYPNPFSFKKDKFTTISFFLNRNKNTSFIIDLYFYNIFGNLIKHLPVNSHNFDFRDTANSVFADKAFWHYSYSLSSKDFDYQVLAPGVYIYLIMYKGQLLGKGKLGVIP
eukprot:COSAG01_NODE_14_length_41020_cov_40.702133_30_plen_193_part_00